MTITYKLNGINIDTKAGWEINGVWHPTVAIKSWDAEQLAEAGIVVEDVQEPTPVEPQPVYKTQFTSLEYLDKFTEAEQLAVVTATLANAQVKLWYDKMLAASFIDIADTRTIGGLDALIGAGLLDASRKAEILAPELIS